jgi:plasmid stabilization system protein ParE
MGSFRILYLPIAENDIIEIIEYIMKDSPQVASEFLDGFKNAISKLADYPESGVIPRDNRLRHMGYRILVVGNYLTFYVIKGRIVEIRRVLHGRRRYEGVF